MEKSLSDSLQRTVLLVEDDAAIAASLAEALGLLGHRVHVYHDGPSALADLAQTQPYAAIVDIGLPGMNGIELGARLRTQLGPRFKLFALTGQDTDHTKMMADVASFDAFMPKPVGVEQLALWLQPDA
jgi:two-component system, OmpR family, response regulator